MLIARGTETKTGSLYLDGPLMDTTLSTEIWTQKGAQGLIEYWNGAIVLNNEQTNIASQQN